MLKNLTTSEKVFAAVAIISAGFIVATCLVWQRPDIALGEIVVWSYFGFSYIWDQERDKEKHL